MKKIDSLLLILWLIALAYVLLRPPPPPLLITPSPLLGVMYGIYFEPTADDAARFHISTFNTTSPQAAFESVRTGQFLVWDREHQIARIYRRGNYVNARLHQDTRYDLYAPMLPEDKVRFSSNHVRTEQGSRYVQWETQLLNLDDVMASKTNYRLIASLFDRPVAWLYQTSTDENGIPFNNRIMYESTPPQSFIYRTWYIWSQI